MKKALLLCASHNDLGTIMALRKLGFYIIVTGNVENLPGQKWCDKYIRCDYSDKYAILEIAKKENITAIVQCCNDYGVYTASYVAEQLSLPGYDSYQTTLLLHNKDKFKNFAIEIGLDCVESKSFIDRTEAINFVKTASFPIIVKPTDASAGNGISKVDVVSEAEAAIDTAFAKSRNNVIVIEPFIQGNQGGFCTFLKNKKVVAVCSNEEYSVLNPYRVEIDLFPSSLPTECKKRLINQIEQIAERLDLCDGIFHLQYIYDGHKAYIIEVMRRILGNMYHVPGNYSTGMDWEYWETRAKTGMTLDGFPPNIKQEGFYAYKTILAERNGIIESISINNCYEKNLIEIFLLKTQGETISNYMSQPIGFMFLMYESYNEMYNSLIKDYKNDFVKIF